jgi:endonuclease/exonuclease/phosphatase family metal-dependent hydrolase
METETLAGSLTDLLAPSIALLLRDDGRGRARAGEAPAAARTLWSMLAAQVKKDESARKWARDLASFPDDGDVRSGFRRDLQRLLTQNPDLLRKVDEAMKRLEIPLSGKTYANWRETFGKEDRATERLEMVYLIRTGQSPEEVAKRFGTDVATVLRINASYSLAGTAGVLQDQGVENWLDRLDSSDPILRRLDMVRLLRSGTPVDTVANAYDAIGEYVERLNEKFSQNGVLGVLTEDDIARFNVLSPPNIRVCTYNLHGTHDDNPFRFRRLARELSRIDPHLCAFQEVIAGAGIENTSAQIGRWMSSTTGYGYRSQFCYCHEFMEKYPEGVAVSLRSPMKRATTIDLNILRAGLKPTMPRNSLAVETEVFGHKVVLASVHLDHNADPEVRLAQGEKLVAEIRRGNEDAYCTVLAGDFNDTENSPVIRYMRSAGFADAYRACHREGGNTFPADDPRSRIDYVFVRGAGRVVSSGLLPNDPALSDHAGVFAEIR